MVFLQIITNGAFWQSWARYLPFCSREWEAQGCRNSRRGGIRAYSRRTGPVRTGAFASGTSGNTGRLRPSCRFYDIK